MIGNHVSNNWPEGLKNIVIGILKGSVAKQLGCSGLESSNINSQYFSSSGEFLCV